ncbi:MAG: TonB family protein [Acidobacteriaceae bacterium]|nr:TonB family protein [Acidobacteriaceae bacterium]
MSFELDEMLDDVVRNEANPTLPAGLEQRLLARLAQAADLRPLAAPQFATAARLAPQRSTLSTWFAMGVHVVAILLIAMLVARHVQLAAPRPKEFATLLAPPPPPIELPKRTEAMGGGGGQHGPTPVTQGHPPKFAAEQLMPPKAPPTVAPKLALEPTVVVQPDLKLADNRLPDLGVPNSTLKGFSLGRGRGTGIGSGNGAGIGPGSGGNLGGGVYRVGGAVHAPVLTYSIEPEFSEEARKAKFSGDVIVGLIVDEQGHSQNVHVLRDVGLGLGAKAVEAVRQYRFRPAIKDGKPVKVEMSIDVIFQIF